MDNKVSISLEFKYSLGKLLLRIIAGVLITILGGVCFVLYMQFKEKQLRSQGIYYYNFRQFDIWQLMIAFLTVAGLALAFLSFWRMVLNERVFLKLDANGLHYKDIQLRHRLFFIPCNDDIYISWDNIESVCLKNHLFIGSRIELTLRTTGNDKNNKQDICIVCNQDNAENILKSIRLLYDNHNSF